MSATLLFWLLAAIAATGAGAVLFAREVTRLAVGLGLFLLGVAGLFAVFGFGFLALAELFVYVGGVLVLVLFAIMLVHRGAGGDPTLESRHDPLAAVSVLVIGVVLVLMLRPLAPSGISQADIGVESLGRILLGSMLPHFELAGLLLLAALVAVVAIAGGERE